MSERKILILTVETIQNYQGTVVPYPESIGCWYGDQDPSQMVKGANKNLRKKAEKLGANAVIGVRYSIPTQMGSNDGEKYFIYATGTPVILDQLPPDPDEYRENMENTDHSEV